MCLGWGEVFVVNDRRRGRGVLNTVRDAGEGGRIW